MDYIPKLIEAEIPTPFIEMSKSTVSEILILQNYIMQIFSYI